MHAANGPRQQTTEKSRRESYLKSLPQINDELSANLPLANNFYGKRPYPNLSMLGVCRGNILIRTYPVDNLSVISDGLLMVFFSF